MRVALAAVLLLVVWPAVAGAQWSAPQTVAGTTGGPLQFAGFGPSGGGALIWHRYEGERSAPNTDVAWISADGSVGPAQSLLAGEAVSEILFPHDDEFVLHAGGPRAVLYAGRVGVGVERRSTTPGGRLLTDEHGHVALLSSGRLRFQRADGSFGRALLALRLRGIDTYGASMSARGDVLVVWSARRRVFARLVRRRGGSGPVRAIGRTERGARFSVALARDRSAVVVWSTQQVSEGEAHSPFRVRAAIARRGGRFGRARILGRVPYLSGPGDTYVTGAGALAAMSPGGRGAVAWTAYRGRARPRLIVRAARTARGRLGRPQRLTAPGFGGGIEELVAGRRGEALALWAGGNGVDQFGLYAAVSAPAQARFGAPEQIHQGITGEVSYADIDGASGRALAAWDTGDSAPFQLALRTPIR